MAKISRQIDRASELTIVKVRGVLGADEALQMAEEVSASNPTLDLIWDMTEADFSAIEEGRMADFMRTARKYASLRPGGRTGIVHAVPSDYGMARMYEQRLTAMDFPIRTRVFYGLEKAMLWMAEDRDAEGE